MAMTRIVAWFSGGITSAVACKLTLEKHPDAEIGAKCLKAYYLDELPPDAGRGQKPLVTECGSTGEGCEIEKMRWYNTRD